MKIFCDGALILRKGAIFGSVKASDLLVANRVLLWEIFSRFATVYLNFKEWVSFSGELTKFFIISFGLGLIKTANLKNCLRLSHRTSHQPSRYFRKFVQSVV